MPALKLVIDVGIQAERALLDQPERPESSNGLADRTRLENSRGCGWDSAFLVCIPVGLRPFDRAAIEHSYAEPANVQLLHAVRKCHGRNRLALDNQCRQNGLLDGRDSLCGGGRCETGAAED